MFGPMGCAVLMALSGPANLGPRAGVLIDFAPLVQMDDGDLTVAIEYRGIRVEPWSSTGGIVLPEEMRDVFVAGLEDSGYKLIPVGKTGVRVLGYARDGKFYPAVAGEARSKTIPAANLPTVTPAPPEKA